MSCDPESLVQAEASSWRKISQGMAALGVFVGLGLANGVLSWMASEALNAFRDGFF